MRNNPILDASNAFINVSNLAATTQATGDVPWVPLGTASASATGEVGAKVLMIGGTVTTITTIGTLTAITGAANLATSQVTSTSSAATLVVARPTRRSVLIRNTDAANSIWVGPATVTTANGFLIKAGESVPFTWVGLIQVIDSGSHAVVAIADEYA